MGKWIVLALSLVSANVAMADCNGPVGIVPEGSSILMYRVQRPPKGVRCEWEYRTCRNGFLSGSYTELFCTETFSAAADTTKSTATR